jgi:hypothetical protein
VAGGRTQLHADSHFLTNLPQIQNAMFKPYFEILQNNAKNITQKSCEPHSNT